MLHKMKAFLKEKDMCVLATCLGGKPHCSLMAYVTDDAGEVVYMTTLKDTQKYMNLKENPQVSLLIDNRERMDISRDRTCALTVSGSYFPPMDPQEKKSILSKISQKHSHLAQLVNDPRAEVLCIRIESFLLLEGALDAHFERVS
ncbi:pyridoxamine 5'-phosphate oxidase family protein [Desulforhabdus amnigena]|uniref:Pyridoxamine 5'-phosphate oxidase N-terminal domain-containing protein n=1 Tax=Desulforhabdus amnigena TaxID=40218 RepID=A0A9W6FUT7_9BACT|nr:pyridoxamine 5'-phosphate oxidase family protein [Desulforhabdus amnigena]NLJ28629.1 pyridoxamine 5'-phosphate oxidase family protein [Deltaproteobacteria bacterium]GLI35239.1 hypothetical protein DAMNIGENAA_26720 [Desulforhabdus amnigena]